MREQRFSSCCRTDSSNQGLFNILFSILSNLGMVLSVFASIATFILSTTRALPSTLSHDISSNARRAVDCKNTNPESFYDPSCWATLDLTNWLNNWHAPSICTDSSDGIGCCGANEEWSNLLPSPWKSGQRTELQPN